MPRYVVERTFPEGLAIPAGADGAQVCEAVAGRNAEEGVTWVHSYVGEDKRSVHGIRRLRPASMAMTRAPSNGASVGG